MTFCLSLPLYKSKSGPEGVGFSFWEQLLESDRSSVRVFQDVLPVYPRLFLRRGLPCKLSKSKLNVVFFLAFLLCETTYFPHLISLEQATRSLKKSIGDTLGFDFRFRTSNLKSISRTILSPIYWRWNTQLGRNMDQSILHSKLMQTSDADPRGEGAVCEQKYAPPYRTITPSWQDHQTHRTTTPRSQDHHTLHKTQPHDPHRTQKTTDFFLWPISETVLSLLQLLGLVNWL